MVFTLALYLPTTLSRLALVAGPELYHLNDGPTFGKATLGKVRDFFLCLVYEGESGLFHISLILSLTMRITTPRITWS